MKILVIDNNSIFREKLTSWLFKEGHDVCDVGYGPETLNILQEYQFDIITLDLKLLPMNGTSIVSQINEVCPNASIIVISATLDVQVTVELIRSGAAACLTKPVDFEVLRKELDRLSSVPKNATAAPTPSLNCELQAL